FAEYGFNKSHSAAYAMLSYRTAYLKANYPVEFMAAVLTADQGNADKISHNLAECNAMNVPVLSPDVNESGADFTPVIEKGKGSIRFGMASIKGVGEGAAQVIIEERKANGFYEDFTDFIVRNADKAVNRRVMEALVKTGCFDSLGEDRATLLDGLGSTLAEAESVRRDREAGQINLFDMLGSDVGIADEDKLGNNRNSAEPMGITEKLGYEKELLGFYISGHPMDAFAGIDEAIDSFQSPDELVNFDERSSFRICGIISNLAIKYTVKDSKQMAVFHLATRTNSYEMIMFPDPYSREGARLENGKMVLIHGLVGRRNGEITLSAHHIFDLEISIPRLISRINFILQPNSKAEEFIELLRETIDDQYGETCVSISFLIEEQIVETQTAQSLTFTITRTNFKKLRRHPALAGVRIEAVDLKPVNDRRQEKRRQRLV
ncbi:MAG: OB-fold nucleic acid binding domain-containing protein, partial [Verrucomicrobiota bacterium]|nr:OB-fold nucleic acid binding domain-containing protein [Verrucomicrobiota bacterium]